MKDHGKLLAAEEGRISFLQGMSLLQEYSSLNILRENYQKKRPGIPESGGYQRSWRGEIED